MHTEKANGTWLQCTHCGKIYFVEKKVALDKLYVASECPECGNTKGLNCGDDENDIYLYSDPYLDARYY